MEKERFSYQEGADRLDHVAQRSNCLAVMAATVGAAITVRSRGGYAGWLCVLAGIATAGGAE